METMQAWIATVVSALAGLSRTLGGVSDTSSSAEKPKLGVKEGQFLAARTAGNLEAALLYLWHTRERVFWNAAEVRAFLDMLAKLVSCGLLPEGQGLYRTWETKFRQTKPVAIEQEYKNFCSWLHWEMTAAGELEPMALAALVEKRLDGQIHPFADGCGRTAKLLAAYVLLRAGLAPKRHRSRGECYGKINLSDREWIEYYSSLPFALAEPEGR